MTASARRPDAVTLVAFVGVAVLGGLNTIAVKVVVGELAPFWSASAQFLAAGALLLLVVLVSRRGLPRGRSLAGAALYGLIAFTGSYAFLYSALRDAHAGTVAVFLALVPLETLALAVVHGQERFRLRGLAGAGIALVGVALVMWDQLGGAVPLTALLLIFAGTLFIAEGGVVLKWIPKADPYATNAVAMLTGGTFLLGLSLLGGEVNAMPATREAWLAMLYLTVLGSIGLFGLYLAGVRRWTASGMSYTTLFMPLVAVPVAAVIVAERVSPAFVAGASIAIIGTYVGVFSAGPHARSTATSAPECMTVDDTPGAAPAVARGR